MTSIEWEVAGKNITSITYNYLNLPLVINFTGNNRIEFIYDATGAKLRKTTYANNTLQETRDYVNGVEYKGGAVDRISHTEGAVVNQAGNFLHEYTIKDHLGNARVTYSDANNDGVITVSDMKQINHYYPFGMNMEGNWNGASGSNKYQYNGKELNSDFGLEWNDYGARYYDASIGRFPMVDPMTEMYSSMSPYHYGKNSPMIYVDPTGMMSEAYNFGMSGSSGSAYDMYNRDAEIAQHGKAEDQPQVSKQLTIYYTNDTKPNNSSQKALTDEEALTAILEAVFILEQNLGVKTFIPKKVNKDFAKTHFETKNGEIFIALINHGNVLPGVSATYYHYDMAGGNTVGVYNQGYWESYANAFHADGNMYKLGYAIAHEILHQLLHYSGFQEQEISKDKRDPGHNLNKPYNLNTSGLVPIRLPSTRNTGQAPRPIETINPIQLIAIKKYLGI